jgi:hypothetical protein
MPRDHGRNVTESVQAETYAAMVVEAEAAVAAVKDPELRRVAFEKILSTLLEQKPSGARGAGRKKRSRPQPKASEKKKSTARKKSSGPKAQIEALIDDGFFEERRTIAEVKAELANRGHHFAITSLSGPLQTLTQDKRLRRQKGEGDNATYAYSSH